MRHHARIRPAVALAVLAAVLGARAEDAPPAASRPWTFVYVMSYDNDLERHAATILEELQRGVDGTPNAVAVLVDDRDPGGLREVTLTGDARSEARLDTDDSSSAEVVGAFLDRVAAHLPARRYVIAFLDHGGGQDEMCWDWAPAPGRGPEWMSASAVAGQLARFRESARGEVALLLLLQCGRADVADLWTFRDAAPLVLASQMRVGAPNTYYRPLLAWLVGRPDATGEDVARRIAAEDRHYGAMTLVDAHAARDLVTRVRPVAAALRRRSEPRAPDGLTPCYGGVRNVPDTAFDLVAWTSAAARGDDAAEAAADELRKWVAADLVRARFRGPLPADEADGWCGVSLFVPLDPRARERHAGHEFEMDTGLDRLWGAVLGD